MDRSEDYVLFRTDTHQQLLDNIEFSLVQISSLRERHSAFSWSVIGSVLSLQGACIHQLDGNDTTQTAVLRKDSQKKVIAHLNDRSSGPFPRERLAEPLELLRRIAAGGNTQADFSSSWSETDKENIERLVMLRNEFVHFLPQGWSVALDGYPDMLTSCWSVISKLIRTPVAYSHRLPESVATILTGKTDEILVEIRKLEDVL
ncbi:MAG: hypothetical protein AAFW65_04720 [Pseudomonadota bacterium]